MDIINLLSSIKGKVLDAAHFEQLKQTYDLQNQNIAQLKESNRLLQEELTRTKKENVSLKSSLEELREQIPSASDASCLSNLSDVALDVLKFYHSQDVTDMFVYKMVTGLGQSQIKVEAAVHELKDFGILLQSRYDTGDGPSYCLTGLGTKYLAKF